MPISSISDKSEIESFDITKKVQYEEDKLDKSDLDKLDSSDLKKLYKIIIELGNSLNVPKEILDKTQIVISRVSLPHAHASIASESSIIIPELPAHILLGKQSFETYISNKTPNFDPLIYKAFCENDIDFLNKKKPSAKSTNFFNSYERILMTAASADEVKGSIAHEFGHLVYRNNRRPPICKIMSIFPVLTSPLSAVLLIILLKDPYFSYSEIIYPKPNYYALGRLVIVATTAVATVINLTTTIYHRVAHLRNEEIFADAFSQKDPNLSKAMYNLHKRLSHFYENCPTYALKKKYFPVHPSSHERAKSFKQALKKA